MGSPKRRRGYYCVRCGSIKTIRLEHTAKNSLTDRVLVHCQNCRTTFAVLLAQNPESEPVPQEGKPFYVLDVCDCTEKTVVRALRQTSQTDKSVHFKSICIACGNVRRINQPLDEIEDIQSAREEFDRYIACYESLGLMAYLLE